ncbi:methyl-accepting chemotaxis protein [Bowmanella yangjiangensis]|uniref:Methyl-accepting chemotaxis protein n=1 Tax=Bowmanella yangjiangensis TaxID=2811230 RepID=A0ABS3CRJ9_9ALTE|nr:methyl-accepting chemotaxis protein [Bowmanella yangjiangensis]MBN7819732.1 methyl-accepting chemotaxis protein [Bowmanella yangjiangensis]
MFFAKTVYLKTVLSVISIVALIVVVLGIINYSNAKRGLFEQSENGLALLEGRLSINLPASIWNFEENQVLRILNSETTLDNVAKIEVYSAAGDLIFESNGDATPAYREVELNYGEGEEAENVGIARVYVDDSKIIEVLSDTLVDILVQDLVLLVALSVFIQLIISKIVSKPLKKAVDAFSDIASGEGDLTRRLEVRSHDEIGMMSEEFNVFVEKIQALVKSMNGVVGETNSAATNVREDAITSKEHLSSLQQETDMVATAIAEMSQSAKEIVLHVKETVNVSNVVRRDTEEVSGIVGKSVESISQLTEELQNAATAISHLEKKVEDIYSVLDVIVGIAEQTNLLALNAAIEAARAGEQGRGFAVVADEVRALASRTKVSTTEIQRTIESLQVGTKSAVQAMVGCQEKCRKSVEYASTSGSSITNILSSTARINDMAAQIESAVSEQSSVSESLNDNVSKILISGQGSLDKVSEMLNSAEKLMKSSEQLNSTVSQFVF